MLSVSVGFMTDDHSSASPPKSEDKRRESSETYCVPCSLKSLRVSSKSKKRKISSGIQPLPLVSKCGYSWRVVQADPYFLERSFRVLPDVIFDRGEHHGCAPVLWE